MPLLSDEDVGLARRPALLSDADVGLSSTAGIPGLLSDADVGLAPPPGPRTSLRGAANALLRGGTRGIGAGLQGAATLAETSPPYLVGAMEGNPAILEDALRDNPPAPESPSKTLARIQRNPVYVAGQALGEVAPEVHPVPPSEEGSFPTRAAEMAGGFVPLIATGPAGPVTMGLQAAGEHISADFDQAKAEGLDDDAAADRAMNRAMGSGALQGAIFWALPKPIRAGFEKFLIDKLGAGAVKRWLAGRVATGTEGAALGATSTAAENVVEERPVTEGAAASAAGLGAANLLLPWLRDRSEEVRRQPPSAPAGEGGLPQPKPPSAPVTQADLDSLKDTLLKNQVYQNRVTAAVQDLIQSRTAVPPVPSAEETAPPGEIRPAAPERQRGESPEPLRQAQSAARGAPNARPSESDEDLQRQLAAEMEHLTAGDEPETTSPGAGAETNTGQNERTGSEAAAARASSAAAPMPAEDPGPPPESPTPRQPPRSLARDRDVLDEVLEVGKISLPKARAIQEDFNPTGVLRKAFTNSGGMGPDEALDALHRAGLYRGLETEDDLLDALKAAGPNRQRNRSRVASDARAQRVESKQFEQFEDKVVQGSRPKSQAENVERVRVDQLLEGDEFLVQGHKFRVRKLNFSEDGRLESLEVKDGPKFGVQTLEPDRAEFIHVDKGSLQEVQRPAGELREEPATVRIDTAQQEREAREREAQTAEVQGREQPRATEPQRPGGGEGTQLPPAPAEAPEPAGALQPAAAETPRELRTTVRQLQPGDRIVFNGVPLRVVRWEPDTIEKFRGRLHLEDPRDPARRGAVSLDGRDTTRAYRPWKSRYESNFPERGPIIANDDTVHAKKAPTPEQAKAAEQGYDPDRIEAWLNKAIEATDFKRDKSMEGILGAPVWATEALANGALRVLRAAYQAGRKLAEAIEAGVHWLRDQKPDGFDEAEARKWMADLARNANPVIQRTREEAAVGAPAPLRQAQSAASLRTRRDEITARLNELTRQSTRPGGLSNADKSERFQLAKESREIQRSLAQDPEHVADLLRKAEQLGNEMQQAKAAGNGLRVRDLGDELKGLLDGDLAAVDPKLLHRVYQDLVARGEIMGSGLKELPLGRTLGELTRFLQSSRINSPGITLAERLNIARDVAEKASAGKDALTRAANFLTAQWQAFKAQWKAPPRDDEFRSLFKERLAARQQTGQEIHDWIKTVGRLIPRDQRQRAISIFMGAQGDENLLRAQLDALKGDAHGRKYASIWEEALKLTDSEKGLARRLELDFEQKLEDAMNIGLLEKGRHDYGVPQIWKKPPKHGDAYDPMAVRQHPRRARNPRANLDPGDPFFALQREAPSYFDGIMAGGDPFDLRIGQLVGLYNLDFHGALTDRGFIKTLKDAREPARPDQKGAGDPTVMISGAARVEPRGDPGQKVYFVDSTWKPKEAVTGDGRPYETVDHWALKGWKFASQDSDGNPIIVHGDFLVHPDHAPFLRNELGKSVLRDLNGPLGVIAHITRFALNNGAWLKANKFASALFHIVTIGEHTVFHAVMPTTRGVDLDFVRNPRLERLVREGGLELGFGRSQELFDEGLAGHGGIWAHAPGLGAAIRNMSDWMFKEFIPKIAAKVGLVVLDRNLRRYGNELTEQQIYELTGRQMNAAFGLQNTALMGSNKTMLDVNRLLLTAPQFLLARSKVVAQALKPYNAEQRYFLLAQAAFVYMGARLFNSIFDKDPHWEAENALSFIFNGRAYSGRFIVNDLFNLGKDLSGAAGGSGLGFVAGRLGPYPRTAIEALSGRDLRTGVRKEVPFETNLKAWRAAQIAVKDLVEWIVPVGAEGLPGLNKISGAAGKGDTALSQVGLAMIGFGSHKYTAQTKMFQMAADFNRSGNDPAAQHYQKQRDTEAHGESAYVKLDNLLDANDPARAAREYQALVAEGYRPESIAQHYAHAGYFTGAGRRELQFYNGLTAGQKEIYQRAQAERRERLEKFVEALRGLQRPEVAR